MPNSIPNHHASARTQRNRARNKENEQYDRHNPGMRYSPNRDERMYGRCGCKPCYDYRFKYMGQLQAPINERGSKMGSINVCDRCPSMVKGNALGVIQIRTSGDPDSTEVITREVCPKCVEEILTLVEMDPGERSERAFTKPYTRAPEPDDISSATNEQLAAALFERMMKQAQHQIESGK